MNRSLLLSVLFFIFLSPSILANDPENELENAWKALNKNDRGLAKEYIQKALNNPKLAVDAYLTQVYLQTFEGREGVGLNFLDNIYKKVSDPNPYLFALWFNDGGLGGYGKKNNPAQYQLLEKLLNDPLTNGSIKTAGHYVKGMHFFFGNDFEKARKEYVLSQGVNEWQFVGPFDNLSGSGFNKSYGPLEHPEPSASFLSTTNAEIKWFKPAQANRDGWTFPHAHFQLNTALIYGQSFVYSPTDQKALLNVGVNGSVKVWVNDQLAVGESKERITEMDCYKNKIQLKKGYNRILVQLGFVNNSFPNYIIRLTDDQYNNLPDLKFVSENQDYARAAKGEFTVAPIVHFAEAYFINKIKSEPNNYINYILLSQTYLRNKKVYEARETIEAALKLAPENSLLRFELIQCLIKENNRTLLMQEVEKIKEKDKSCLLTYQLNIQKLTEEEKYDEALKEVENRIALFGKDEDILEKSISIYAAQKKFEDVISVAQEAYKTYPENAQFNLMMFNIKKEGYKDIKGAIKVLEEFQKHNYNYDVFKTLSATYIEQGMFDKGINLLEKMSANFSYDPELVLEILKLYFEKHNYKRSLELCKQTLALAPYVSSYWENLGLVYEQLSQKEEAISAYKKALYYNKSKFSSRAKIRSLEGKKDVYEAFPGADPYELIKAQPEAKHKEFNYYYILDEKYTVVYPERATEEYVTYVVKIINEKGIDTWKESSIPYNSYTQSLFIEKAELVKPNGTKMPAEKNDNEVVFTGLEAGDAIILKYKIQNFTSGRLGQEFWDKFSFNAFVPTEISRYCLLVDRNIVFSSKVLNSKLQPAVSDFENFKLYTWEMKNVKAFEDEPLMPPLNDVGAILHISSVKGWQDISKWYSDIVSSSLEEEFEIKNLYAELFPAGKTYSEFDKAKKIYNYIATNIRYSSVSFRQGAYIPQKPSATYNTRMGDCKDVSALFFALAKFAGLKANLVLVDTRDNGQHDMSLPSVEFNHCIVRLELDGKEYFIELTDSNLPFASLPSNLFNALSLNIPEINAQSATAELRPIKATHRTKELCKRVIQVQMEENNLKLNIRATKTGALTSALREEFASLPNDKQKEELEKGISSGYKNPVKVHYVEFTGLSELSDSVHFNYSYTIKNEIAEVGEMKMFKMPLIDVVASIDNFSTEKRNFPIEYWSYENTDEYETILNVEAPAGKQFIEVPKDVMLNFKDSKYSLKFVKTAPGKLTVTRKSNLNRENISPEDYKLFKEFFDQIVKAESKFIVVK